MIALIKKLARATSRTAKETKEVSSGQTTRAMHFLYYAILFILLAIFVPTFIKQFGRWSKFNATVKFSKSLWHVVYKTPDAPCGYDLGASNSPCVASPSTPTLWESPFLRSDPQHRARVHEITHRPYWLGAEVPASLLLEAGRARANHLLLGWFLSSARIWIDGQFIMSSAGTRDSQPVVITLPISRLFESKPLKIAILLQHDSDAHMADSMNRLRGGEGFLTTESLNSFREFVTFWLTVRPFSLLVAYTVIASLFFSFWMSATIRTEYFFMALFALASAFYQARMTNIFALELSRSFTSDLDIILRFYLASFGMALGLSFARARLAYFKWGLPIALGLPFLVLLFQPDSSQRQALTHALQAWATPTFYCLGAGLCFLQAFYLWSEQKFSLKLPQRIQRLLGFGAGLCALTGFSVLEFSGHMPELAQMIWLGMGFEHFVFVVYFGTIVLRESRAQTSIATLQDAALERSRASGKKSERKAA